MTDKDIIQVLQYIVENGSGACDKCPVFPCGKIKDYEDNQCGRFIAENALDLINRQKAEIDELEKECDRQYEQAEADIRANIANGGTSCHWCMDRNKSEAVKEFAERLKKVWFDNYYDSPDLFFDDFVDTLAKEMVGDD